MGLAVRARDARGKADPTIMSLPMIWLLAFTAAIGAAVADMIIMVAVIARVYVAAVLFVATIGFGIYAASVIVMAVVV